MYFWNTSKLVKDFIEQKVTQEQKFQYYLLSSVLLAFFMEVLLNFPMVEYPSQMRSVGSLLIIGITFFGVKACFACNAKGDNLEFIDRMTCLTVPITVRIMTIYAIVYMGMFAVIGENPQFEVISDVIIEIIFFKMLVTNIDKIAKGRISHG